MQNFPTINWAIQFTHLFEEYGVLLPYKEYLEYVDRNPKDEEKLQDMKVTIDESALITSFKYVAMDIDDDKCLYLLYKIRKSLLKIQEQGLSLIKRKRFNN
jgi:exodeoxyribonuclease V alpha subunit